MQIIDEIFEKDGYFTAQSTGRSGVVIVRVENSTGLYQDAASDLQKNRDIVEIALREIEKQDRPFRR